MSWLQRPVKGLLIDISGVLYIGSGPHSDGVEVPGSVEAIKKLRNSKIPFRLCSNETQNTRQGLLDKLKRLGFDLCINEIFTPAPAVVKVLKERNLRPYLLVHPKQLPEFSDVNQENPNCVVVGDAAEQFTYENMNKAFNLLLSTPNAVLISMGLGKFYKETDGMMLDLGAYTKALEYACDIKAENVGKPESTYFALALDDLKLKANEVVMIGDDIVSDVGGAQKCGMRGVQVRTGKWLASWENHPSVKPCAIVTNLADAINQITANR